jgi:hypothetical protein
VSGALAFFFPGMERNKQQFFPRTFQLNEEMTSAFAGIIPSAGYSNIMIDTLNVNTGQ